MGLPPLRKRENNARNLGGSRLNLTPNGLRRLSKRFPLAAANRAYSSHCPGTGQASCELAAWKGCAEVFIMLVGHVTAWPGATLNAMLRS